MNLERLCIKTHLRTHWQAIDLGFLFARQWYFVLWALWSIPFTIVAIPLTIFLKDHLTVAAVILWWLKPLFDRAPLYFASRVLFSEKLTISSTLKQFYRINKLDWLPWLSLRRFNLTRSFDLPITQLEQLTGSQRRLRLKTLHGRGNGSAVALTFASVLFEVTLYFGCLFLIAVLVPDQVNFNLFASVDSSDYWFGILDHCLMIMSMTVVAPFYISAGFMLYINRRIELEAWDIEIQFRKMSAQYSKNNAVTKISTITLPIVLTIALQITNGFPTALASADDSDTTINSAQQESIPPIDSTDQAKKRINTIMDSELFNQYEEVTRWRLKQSKKNEEIDTEEKHWFERLIEWLKAKFDSDESNNASKDLDFSTFTLFVEITLWLTLFALLCWFVYRYRSNLTNLLRLRNSTQEKQHQLQVTTLLGLPIGTDNLPKDVVQEVNQLISGKSYREALSLLYRASLTMLIEQKSLRFSESTTEIECLNKVRQIEDHELTHYIEQLTTVWQSLAYGHLQPNPQSIQNLCAEYQLVFKP